MRKEMARQEHLFCSFRCSYLTPIIGKRQYQKWYICSSVTFMIQKSALSPAQRFTKSPDHFFVNPKTSLAVVGDDAHIVPHGNHPQDGGGIPTYNITSKPPHISPAPPTNLPCQREGDRPKGGGGIPTVQHTIQTATYLHRTNDPR